MGDRIAGQRVNINAEHVKSFFDRRGQTINQNHPLTSVLYQDSNPILAAERDAYEKGLVLPQLRLSGSERLLDIGCGIGRWADEVASRVSVYHGIDLSQSLIDAARTRHAEPHVSFQVMAGEDLADQSLDVSPPFDRIIVAGVMIYMNDEQLDRMLGAIAALTTERALLYIREPVATESRLTLNQFWSDELQSEYSAIYRTEAELMELFDARLLQAGFRIVTSGPLYNEVALNNRRETKQHYFILERGAP